MDLNKYDSLRNKYKTKDFEGKNKGLDSWLYKFSYFGNFGSVFFAIFLVYPALFKTITAHVVGGSIGLILSVLISVGFLVMFEIIKRYLITNFSNDFVSNSRKLKPSIMGWFVMTITVIALSFYFSISGSKNFATTNNIVEAKAETYLINKMDSLKIVYDEMKMPYLNRINEYERINLELADTIKNTPLNYITARKEYQININYNKEVIDKNKADLDDIDNRLKIDISDIRNQVSNDMSRNADEDFNIMIIFIIIVVFNEVLIVLGLYFREFYEHTLLVLNQQKYEKVYLKRDRYRSLLSFIYNDGKNDMGDRVISGTELKATVLEKTKIPNSNKLIDEFLKDMDGLSIFTITGKRRFIAKPYHEAIRIIESFDDSHRILENMR